MYACLIWQPLVWVEAFDMGRVQDDLNLNILALALTRKGGFRLGEMPSTLQQHAPVHPRFPHGVLGF